MYFLEYEPKEDATHSVALSLNCKYKKFGEISDLIKFLFNGAVYIDQYKIYEGKLLNENDVSGHIRLEGCDSSIDIR